MRNYPADHRLVHFEIARSMKEVLTAFEVDIRGPLKEKEVSYFLLWIGLGYVQYVSIVFKRRQEKFETTLRQVFRVSSGKASPIFARNYLITKYKVPRHLNSTLRNRSFWQETVILRTLTI